VTNISAAGRWVRNSALVAQIGLALIPLCGAGLLIRSFQHLQQISPGFDPEHRLTLMVSLPKLRYGGPKDVADAARRISQAASNAPGVRRAGMVQALPFAPGLRWLQAVSRNDPLSIVNFSALPLVRYTVVTAGYFEAMGIELKSGRLLNDSDIADSQPVVVINERLARDHFAGENPVGQQIWIDHAESLPKSRPRIVVGVVADSRMDRMEAMPDASAWVPIAQQDHSDSLYRNLYLVAQTGLAPASTMAGIRERIHSIDPDLALSNVAAMETRLADSMWRQRFSALVVGALGIAALAIAALGVFGITSYLVACRTYEIGVRMAVGAAPSSVLRMVLGQGLAMALIGLCVGLGGAFALTRILSTFLFGVSSTDPLTFGVVALTLVATAALASYFPARRAAAVDPIVALRLE
jgi:predicted permease